MHDNNHKWVRDIKERYPSKFSAAKVLEIGSCVYAGESMRQYFDEKSEYTGVDQFEGSNVDIVCDAKKTAFKKDYFDVLILLSVFEHDTGWRETLIHNLKWLKPGGLAIICFGAEENEPHFEKLMGWAIVPHQEFLDYCKTLPVEILDAFFEEERYGKGCLGAYDVLLKKL